MSSKDPTKPAKFFADLFGVTERRIQQLAKDGVIPKAGRGQYPFIGTIRGYVRFLQERQEAPNTNKEGEAVDYRGERTKLVIEQRRKIELQNEQTAGNLCVKFDMQIAMADAFKMVQNTVQSIPDRLERDCQLNPAELKPVEKACDAICEELGDTLFKHFGGDDGN